MQLRQLCMLTLVSLAAVYCSIGLYSSGGVVLALATLLNEARRRE